MEAGGNAAGKNSSLGFSFALEGIWIVLAAGLVLRLILAFFPGFDVDIDLFRYWSTQLADRGPWHFYDQDFFTDYAPGYMYVLLFFGKLDQLFGFSSGTWEYILKLPSIVADLASAYMIWRLLEGKKPEIRLGAAALYLLLWPVLLIGPIWGQVDSVLAFFLLLSVFYISEDRPVAGAVAFTVGFMVKPQAVAALPFLALWIMRRYPIKDWWKPALAGLAVVAVLITPFFLLEPWKFIDHMRNSTEVYKVNSFWAYNFWNMFGVFDSGFRPDVSGIEPGEGDTFGLNNRVWGVLMFAASVLAIIVALRKTEGRGWLAFGTGLSVLAFYVFMTRMHERYAFPAFALLLVACVLIEGRLAWRIALWTLCGVLAIVHFFNLYHVYMYYNPNSLKWNWAYDQFADSNFLGTGYETLQLLSAVLVAGFVALLAFAFVHARVAPDSEAA